MEKFSSDEGDVIRKRIQFYGEVQGVGFRYRARHAATGCMVTGWVENKWDGSVLMEIQGTSRQINEVLRMINMGSFIRIERMDTKVIPIVENEKRFECH